MAEKIKYKIEVHLIHSKLQQIRGKLKYKKFMKADDFIEANLRYLERISLSIKNEYGLITDRWEWRQAVEMMMPGLEPDDFRDP